MEIELENQKKEKERKVSVLEGLNSFSLQHTHRRMAMMQ